MTLLLPGDTQRTKSLPLASSNLVSDETTPLIIQYNGKRYTEGFLELVRLAARKGLLPGQVGLCAVAIAITETSDPKTGTRGGWKLFRDHNNPFGIKWAGKENFLAAIGANPRWHGTFKSHDGSESYASFPNLALALKGWYAVFNEPRAGGWLVEGYCGHTDLVDNPEDWIRRIGPAYCPNAGYADAVIANLPEARAITRYALFGEPNFLSLDMAARQDLSPGPVPL